MEMNFIKIRQFADKLAFRERAGANMQGLRVRRTELEPQQHEDGDIMITSA
jgi:hypothetical protein